MVFAWVLAFCLGVAMVLGGSPAAQAKSNGWLKDVVRVGVLDDPKTLNVWLASDVWSRHVLRLIYQTLYIREPGDLTLAPWMAAGPAEYDPEKLTYTIKLRPAKWSDGSEFTAEDVVFTANLIKKFKVPRYSSKWGFVKKIEALDKHTVRFTLSKAKAIFISRTLATPMVQKKQWAPVAAKAAQALLADKAAKAKAKAAQKPAKPAKPVKTSKAKKPKKKKSKKLSKPLAILLRFKPNPIGTGPFVVADWKKGAYVYLKRNPHFFGQGLTIAGRKLGPHVKGILFKVYGNADAAILALRKGDIDMYLNGIQSGYMDEIAQDKNIKVFNSKRSALYYLGFNLRKPPFNDKAMRRAVACMVDKSFIINRVMQGGALPMHSIVPPGNTYFYNPGCKHHSDGASREKRIKRAYEILKKAGYSWEQPPVGSDGELQLPAEGLKGPDGKPVQPFTLLTPPADYDPNRAMAGMLIQEWLRELGMPVDWRPMSFSALIQRIKYEHKFDCFVLGYGRLDLDPGYLRLFFHSSQDKLRGWNMSGYRNPLYDKLSIASDGTMDPNKRREMILKLQEILMDDIPYFPLYNPLLSEGARVDRFVGWVPMVEGIGNIWSFLSIRPAGANK